MPSYLISQKPIQGQTALTLKILSNLGMSDKFMEVLRALHEEKMNRVKGREVSARNGSQPEGSGKDEPHHLSYSPYIMHKS